MFPVYSTQHSSGSDLKCLNLFYVLLFFVFRDFAMARFWLFCAFFVLAFAEGYSSQNYASNTIVVKFCESSKLYDDLTYLGATKAKAVLESLIGEFKLEPAINPKLIDYAQKKFSKFNRSSNSDFISHLRRIFFIKYEKDIDPIVVCSKLSFSKDIEYVEPLFFRRIDSLPNDIKLSDQYYLGKIQAFGAWSSIRSDADTIIVGIIDTGVDIDHPDLKSNIFINYGEFGQDSTGVDKSGNGIDDDGNGYVDDYVGWDFCGKDNASPDNNPRPGNGHGTHVAGIVGAVANNSIGIAGIVPKVKILPVKVSNDDPFNSYVSKGYEGILYAGVMGAKVVNCSWGSESGSNLENDVIKTVNAMDVCVVAAAGNNYRYSDYAPASFKGVLSVAAVDSNDIKAVFSNYSSNVDVSAPGVDIMSTVPGETYAAWDGTSMASPVASGVVALVRQQFPNLNYEQTYEVVKLTADNIDSLNPDYAGYIGSGRVNAFKAITCNIDTLRSLLFDGYTIRDDNGNNLYELGERLSVSLTFRSILSNLKKVYLKFDGSNPYIESVCQDSLFIGDFLVGEQKTTDEICFTLSNSIPLDFNLRVNFIVYDSLGKIGKATLTLPSNPSYKTMGFNNISATFNSRGNIGFNDYPLNQQGIGFMYKKSNNILFEGALLIGIPPQRVSDVARSSNQNYQNRGFITDSIFSITFNPTLNYYLGNSKFHSFQDSTHSAFNIEQNVYQSVLPEDSNQIFVNYNITNMSGEDYDSLFVGLFFDWDISLMGQSDKVEYDRDFDFGYAFDASSDTLPYVGVKVFSEYPVNFYAIDNDGRGDDSVGVYDGFTIAEKWKMLSKGKFRTKSRITDVSYVISAGPIKILNGETKRVAFGLFAGSDLLELRKESLHLQVKAYELGLISEPYPKLNDSYLASVFPNPTKGDLQLRISFLKNEPLVITLFDLQGRLVEKVDFADTSQPTFEYQFDLSLQGSGNYYLCIQSPSKTQYIKIAKIK